MKTLGCLVLNGAFFYVCIFAYNYYTKGVLLVKSEDEMYEEKEKKLNFDD